MSGCCCPTSWVFSPGASQSSKNQQQGMRSMGEPPDTEPAAGLRSEARRAASHRTDARLEAETRRHISTAIRDGHPRSKQTPATSAGWFSLPSRNALSALCAQTSPSATGLFFRWRHAGVAVQGNSPLGRAPDAVSWRTAFAVLSQRGAEHPLGCSPEGKESALGLGARRRC